MNKFDKKVYEIAAKIPAGQVRSYSWVAEKIGNPRAARAVGQALKRNPTPIVVPCHRVVCKDGRLGGFSRGLRKKVELLRREGVEVRNGRVIC